MGEYIGYFVFGFIGFIIFLIIFLFFRNKETYPEAPTPDPTKLLDLHKMSIDQVVYELKLNLATPNPKDLSLMSEVNQRYKLGVEQQKLILENRQNLVSINLEDLHLKAFEVLSDEILKFFIQDKRSTMANMIAIKAERHNFELAQLKNARELNDLKVEAEKALLRNAVAEIEHKEADLRIKVGLSEFNTRKNDQDLGFEAERFRFELDKDGTNLVNDSLLQRTKIEFEDARVRFINNLIDNVRIEDLPNGLRTYLVATVVNSNASNPNDFERQEILNKFLDQQIQSELNLSEQDRIMKEQKVAQETVVAEEMRFKSEQRRRDIGT